MGESIMDMYCNACVLGFQKVFKTLDQITDNTKFDLVKDALHYDLLALIHCIGDIYARMKAQKTLAILSKEELQLFLGFVYLNNQLKHDPELNAIYYEVSGGMYPMKYPYRYDSPGVYWKNFQDHGKSREAKRLHYDATLNRKDVRRTLELLEKVIMKYIAREVQ